MKILSMAAVTVLAGVIMLANTACDWSSSGSSGSFNTSKGAGVNINYSGVYRGEFSGGRAVEKTSRGNITTLTMVQTGNRLTVYDNQGSVYSGATGSPGLIAEPAGSVYPFGAEIVQSQISFKGKDKVSGNDIEFVGILHVVSVTDIQGNTSETETETDTQNGDTQTTVIRNETTTETITVINEPPVQITTRVITENATGREISRTTTTRQIQRKTSSTVFQITEANTQLRLEGTWIEKGGPVSGVKARSTGGIGLVERTSEVSGE
ncbi:MAG TPA: hypothetical protein PJ991_05110 [Kiritimatiellia bacterium]|nr:hypothetical protein [Kiritimatiellia bacterium]